MKLFLDTNMKPDQRVTEDPYFFKGPVHFSAPGGSPNEVS